MHRGNSDILCAYVRNKNALREYVLDKYVGGNSTKTFFKCSDFFSKDLFGPLPLSVKHSLYSSANASSLVCRLSSYPRSSSLKRPAPQQSSSSKRPRQDTSVNQGSYNPRQNFPRYSAKKRPPQTKKKSG